MSNPAAEGSCRASGIGRSSERAAPPRRTRGPVEDILHAVVPPDFTSRLLAFLGLELDVSFTLRREALSRVTETLFVGARPRPEDVAGLRDAGITHVVSCLEERELAKLELEGLDARRLGIPLRDGMDQDIAAWFPRLFEFATRAREVPGSRLLIHCEAGVSRSATLATALLMEQERLRFFEAFARLRARRAEVLPNIGFASQLQQLENALHADGRASGEPSSLCRYLRDVCSAPVEAELLQEMLERYGDDAPRALRAMFGGEIPRVVQGVRL